LDAGAKQDGSDISGILPAREAARKERRKKNEGRGEKL